MINLKEAEAINYLDRVDNTLDKFPPEKNGAGKDRILLPLRLTHAMIKIQRAYLSALSEDPGTSRDLIVCSVTSTGFPELPSWLGDIGRAFKEFDGLRQRRGEAYLPVLEQGSSVPAVEDSFDRLTQVLRRDQIITSAVGDIKIKEEVQMLRDIVRNSGSPKVYEDPNLSMLGFRYTDDPHSTWYTSVLKYIDGPEEKGKSPLLYFKQDKVKESEIGEKLSKGKFLGGLEGQDLWVHGYSHPLLKRLLTGNYSEVGLDGFYATRNELANFDNLLRVLNENSSHLLDGQGLDPTEYVSSLKDIRLRINSAITEASSQELRVLFQQVFDDEIAKLSGVTRKVAGVKAITQHRSPLRRAIGWIPGINL